MQHLFAVTRLSVWNALKTLTALTMEHHFAVTLSNVWNVMMTSLMDTSSLIIISLIAVILLTLALYRRAKGMPVWVRILLAVSRFVMLCILVSALFEPTITVKRKETTKKRLSVMIDVSQSMSIKDQRKSDADIIEAATAMGYVPFSSKTDARDAVKELDGNQRLSISDASRLDLAKHVLEQASDTTLKDLSNDLDINYYAFGSSLKMLKHGQNGETNTLASLKAVETSTTLAESLSKLAGTGRGSPLAGIVLLTDGLDTSLRRSWRAWRSHLSRCRWSC